MKTSSLQHVLDDEMVDDFPFRARLLDLGHESRTARITGNVQAISNYSRLLICLLRFPPQDLGLLYLCTCRFGRPSVFYSVSHEQQQYHTMKVNHTKLYPHVVSDFETDCRHVKTSSLSPCSCSSVPVRRNLVKQDASTERTRWGCGTLVVAFTWSTTLR